MDREPHQTAAADFEAIRSDLHATARLQKKVQRQIDEMIKEGKERRKEYEERQKEQQKEYEERQKEQQKEYEERQKEYEQRHKEYDRKFGDLSNRWGRFVESLVEGDLVAMLREKNIEVETIAERVRGKRNGEHFEFDIVAVNAEEVVVVEVKSTLRAEDIKHFLDRLENFTRWSPLYKGKKVYGAVAYLQVVQSAEIYAERQGLFVIRATGDSASIINRDGFLPKTFH